MSDTIAVLMILAAAPAATAFPIAYAIFAPWWRTVAGRALMTSSVALALLIDISLLYQWLGSDYALRDVVRFSVYGLILAGTWMQLGALVYQQIRYRTHFGHRR